MFEPSIIHCGVWLYFSKCIPARWSSPNHGCYRLMSHPSTERKLNNLFIVTELSLPKLLLFLLLRKKVEILSIIPVLPYMDRVLTKVIDYLVSAKHVDWAINRVDGLSRVNDVPGALNYMTSSPLSNHGKITTFNSIDSITPSLCMQWLLN